MHNMDTCDNDSKRWVDIKGWPRAHIATGHGSTVLVLTDEFEPGLPGGPHWLIVCPWCQVTPFAIPRKEVFRKTKPTPSCGCRNSRHENFQGDYRKIRGRQSV